MKLLPKPAPKCEECGVGANVITLFSRHHACGRACLKRVQEQEAKIALKLSKDAG